MPTEFFRSLVDSLAYSTTPTDPINRNGMLRCVPSAYPNHADQDSDPSGCRTRWRKTQTRESSWDRLLACITLVGRHHAQMARIVGGTGSGSGLVCREIPWRDLNN